MNLDAWHDLFVAAAGAGSALAGLIIVAMTANIRTILAIPSMTSRSATTIAGLTLTVVVSCAALVPDQSPLALGIEVAAIGAMGLVIALRSAVQIVRSRGQVTVPFALAKSSLGVVPNAGLVLAGALIAVTADGGLHVLAAALVTGFAAYVLNAWVLLVEVLR